MFESVCGDSAACSASLGAAMVLGLTAAGCWLVVLVAAFKDSPRQGVLSLVLPCPYGLYYMFAKLKHPRKALLIAGVLGGAVLAGGLQHASTAVWGPDLARQEGFDADFEDDFEDDLGGFEDDFEDDLGGFEDDFEDDLELADGGQDTP